MGNKIISLLLAFLFMNVVVISNAQASHKYYDLFIYNINLTRLCNTTVTLTANGTLPGPTIYAEQGEIVHVNVHNNGTHGITIHWHGVLQRRNPWSDGPLYVTQCYIEPGSNFTQKLLFSVVEGTVWYHAHSDWSMTTVHGAIVIYPPKRDYPYPIIPDGEQTIVLATWYIDEVMKLYKFIKSHHYWFPRANATTINGQPGYPNNCSAETSFQMTVEYNKTYLLRIVNAILNEDQFFGIAGHSLILVGNDGSYTEPLTTEYIRIAPGQTMDVLFTANQSPGYYYMASHPYFVGTNIPGLTNTTTTAIVRYSDIDRVMVHPSMIPFPKLPAVDDTAAALHFTSAIRSSNRINRIVPKTVDKNVIIIPSFGKINDIELSFLNNISFVAPNISILEAYTRNMSGYFDEDFPTRVEDIPDDIMFGTKAIMLNYSDAVQIVFESADVHPMHIHGFTFYVVAFGQGKFKDVEDKLSICTKSPNPTKPCYNLVDPPELNTVSVPVGGWAAIRFFADNPGVWFMHCHFERHHGSGMSAVLIVKNGIAAADQGMLPRPNYMPPCSCPNRDLHGCY